MTGHGRAMPGDDAGRSYRRLVADLAAATGRRDAELAAAQQSFVDGQRAIAAEQARAAEAVAAATRRVQAAAATVAATDRETARLWAQLRVSLGWRGGRLGTAPPPDLTTLEADPARLVRQAAQRLAYARQGRAQPAGNLPWPALALLPAAGALTAALVACVAAGLLVLGTAATSLLGQLVFFGAPFTGLPVAAAWARRRHDARLDTGAIGLTVIGGMLACIVVMTTLR